MFPWGWALLSHERRPRRMTFPHPCTATYGTNRSPVGSVSGLDRNTVTVSFTTENDPSASLMNMRMVLLGAIGVRVVYGWVGEPRMQTSPEVEMTTPHWGQRGDDALVKEVLF
eukprot:TRINITY_DN42774_c0_g1_i1.p2 TRINITY_DN42774_c0_g1~~TRINITY_DN42774_c0_g1_i1.p2  ORF type:complete len:113 (-),score=10.63 TRINITY_DN42774_c0_g1_i1:383-721(-)